MNRYTVTFKWGLHQYILADILAERSIIAIAKAFGWWEEDMEHSIPINYTVKVRRQDK